MDFGVIVTIVITAFQVNEGRRSADRTQESAVANLELAARKLALAERSQVSERFSSSGRTARRDGTQGGLRSTCGLVRCSP